MSKIKIILEKGETQEQAEERLVKALLFKSSGENGHDKFVDPAMEDLYQQTLKAHEKMLDSIIKEVIKELE